MISDEERREVARRLRSVGLDDIRYSDAICEVMACAGLTCVGGEDCHGSDEHPECVVRVFARLADLIEPSESGQNLDKNRDTVQIESPAVQIACECDRAGLLALADDIDKQTDGSMFDAWLEDGHCIARRIREACGEVDG